jgi:hypothetical protein
MERSIAAILIDGSLFQLSCMIGMALFFAIVGLREIRDERPEGYLFLTLSLFFLLAHALFLSNLPTSDYTWQMLSELSFWSWLVLLFAPALITLFLVRGLLNFAMSRSRIGTVKIFFGLTLFCYLYMVGSHWPLDVRGLLTTIWLILLFRLELGVAES